MLRAAKIIQVKFHVGIVPISLLLPGRRGLLLLLDRVHHLLQEGAGRAPLVPHPLPTTVFYFDVLLRLSGEVEVTIL